MKKQLISVAWLLIAIDQLTKWYARSHFVTPLVVNKYLTFTLVYNRGVSWGLFAYENVLGQVLIALLTTLIMVLLMVHIRCSLSAGKLPVGETLVMAGALSNLFDRLIHGGVVDFVLLSYNDWSWPIFNLADCFIVVGIGIMMFTLWRESRS